MVTTCPISPSPTLVGLPRHRTRAQDLYANLVGMLEGLPADTKLPTVAQLCDQWQASAATLTDVLDTLENEGRIRRIRGIGIFALRPSHRHIIVLCDPGLLRNSGNSPFWDQLLQEISRRSRCTRDQLDIYLAKGGSAAESLPTKIQQLMDGNSSDGPVDGLLAIGLSHEIALALQESKLPVVGFAMYAQRKVEQDFADMVARATTALARQGCRRIGFWMPDDGIPLSVWTSVESKEKYRDSLLDPFRVSLENCVLPYLPHLVRRRLSGDLGHVAHISPQVQGFMAAFDYFSGPSHEWPDGLVIGDDNMTAGSLSALARVGIRPGAELKVASHANRGSTVLPEAGKHLTLMEFEATEVVDAMFQLMDEGMAGNSEAKLILVKAHLRTPIPEITALVEE